MDNKTDIIMTWEITRENIKASLTELLGYYELKHHKSWFEEQ
jgi:hypothetical protein